MIDTFDQDIQDLVLVSPKVNEYITEQHFLMDTEPDNVNEAYILSSVYTLILRELVDRGIYCFTDNSDLLSDWYTAKKLYHLYVFTTPTNLINLFTNNIELIPSLEQLIISDLPTSELYTSFIELVEPVCRSSTSFNEVYSLQHCFTSNEHFIELLEVILESVNSQQYSIQQDPQMVVASLKEKLEDRNEFINLLQYLSSHIYDKVDMDYLRKEISNYDSDKLVPGNINMFAWIYLSNQHKGDGTEFDPNLFPKEILKKQTDFLDQHHSSINHHIEYYLANRNFEITLNHIVLLFISRYDESRENKDSSLTELVNELIDKAGDRFTEEHVTFLIKLKDLTLKYTR